MGPFYANYFSKKFRKHFEFRNRFVYLNSKTNEMIDTNFIYSNAGGKVTRGFIQQTAADYAMPDHSVENIFVKHGLTNLYDELEAFIKERREKAAGETLKPKK